MTDEKLEWLLANDVSISTSLDGDKVNHNNNRTGYDGDSFERVTYWIKRINNRFTELGSTKRVGAILTVTRENFKDYKNIIDAYVEL